MGQCILYLKALYTGEDLAKIDEEYIDKTEAESNVADFQNDAANATQAVLNFFNSETGKRFAKNPLGFSLTYIYDGLKYILGDTALTLAHAITFSDTKFMYNYNQLNSDEYKAVNQYTKVGKYKKRKTLSWQKELNIPLENSYKDEEYRRFSNTTEIPVIMIDLYNIASDNIEFFDINFFDEDNVKHPRESAWTHLRDFTISVTHIAIYLSAAILLVSLIVTGIQIIRHTFDNPQARAEHIKSLRKFLISLLMIVGTILIMILCTYGSDELFNDVKVESRKELPIRVNVEEAKYSFNTNITGYFRYMAEIEGIHNYREKGLYTFIYIALAWANLTIAVFMTCRTFVLMILTMIGPILAVLYSFNIQGVLRYKNWMILYLTLSFTQIIFAIIYRVIFEYII